MYNCFIPVFWILNKLAHSKPKPVLLYIIFCAEHMCIRDIVTEENMTVVKSFLSFTREQKNPAEHYIRIFG